MAMADEVWGTARPVEHALFDSPQQFEFFEAVRLLGMLRDHANTTHAEQALRFAVEPTLAFPSSSVVRVERDVRSAVPTITVAFFGLLGPVGVLPQLYTEQAIQQRFAGDPSFAAFFDIFHDRLLRLFYHAWAKPRLFLEYDRPGPADQERPSLATYLFALIGMGTGGLAERLPCRHEALLRYAGLLAQRPRSAECLRAFLQDFFGVAVTVEQFIGRWHTLEPDECCVLGMDESNSQLGLGSVAGDAVWTRDAMIRIGLGPLTATQFPRFLPDTESFATMAGLTRWFLGQSLSFELQPTLAAGEKPVWMRLNDDATGPRLGWTTWLTDEPFAAPALDAVFSEGESLEGVRSWH